VGEAITEYPVLHLARHVGQAAFDGGDAGKTGRQGLGHDLLDFQGVGGFGHVGHECGSGWRLHRVTRPAQLHLGEGVLHQRLVAGVDQNGFKGQAAVLFRAQDIAPAEGILGQDFHVAAIQAGDARRLTQPDVIPVDQGQRIGRQQVGEMAAAEALFHAHLGAIRHQGHRVGLAAANLAQVAIQGREAAFMALAGGAVADG